MDNPARRARRRQNRRPFPTAPTFGGMKNLVVFCLVIAMIQCFYSYSHPSKRELCKLMRNVDDIAKELIDINNNYKALESKVSVYSAELPKLEEQLVALEAMAQSKEASRTTCDSFGMCYPFPKTPVRK